MYSALVSSVFAAIVGGSALFLASIPSIIPFYLAHRVYTNPYSLSSIHGTSITTLFLFGVFLGRVSGSNIIYSGIEMVARAFP